MGPVSSSNNTFPPPYPTVTISSAAVPPQVVEIDITSVGALGVAQFQWKLGGVVQGTNLVTAATVQLAAGISATFAAAGLYSANTVYISAPSTGGFPSVTEPAWPTTVGATVANGNCIFQCMGPTASFLNFVPRGQDDAPTKSNAQTELLPYGNIFQNVVASYTNIATAGFD